MSSIDLAETDIVNELFEFIELNFNDFECKGPNFSSWWWGKSWSPYIEACFIAWGKRLMSEQKIHSIGHSFTHSNITDFMERIGHGPYDKNNKFPDKCFDVSWHGSKKLILALEHEETTRGNSGSTVENHLLHIFEEIDKLNDCKAKFKILVSRPHLRKLPGRKDTYPNAIKHFKTEIERKLLNLEISSEEKWIVILIGPNNRLKPNEETEILFCNYTWNENNLVPVDTEKRLKVKMNEEYEVRKI